jgi:hypothetical protein
MDNVVNLYDEQKQKDKEVKRVLFQGVKHEMVKDVNVTHFHLSKLATDMFADLLNQACLKDNETFRFALNFDGEWREYFLEQLSDIVRGK